MPKKIVAIIQARLSSTRLPGKVLMEIKGRPMLWHVIRRVSAVKRIDAIMIATSLKDKDDKLEKFSRENKVKIFRGSEDDCLDRYYKAAKACYADVVVRITADCPLICPEVIDRVISEYLKGNYDYASNTLLYTYPDGCDVEVFSFNALKKAYEKAKDPVAREHVTPYFINSGLFRIKNVENDSPVEVSKYKWSVDRIEDLRFVRKVYDYLYKNSDIFTMQNIIGFVRMHPEISKINSEAVVNEGYYKSILGSPKISARKLKIRNSAILKKKTQSLIPDCSQTFSKGPTQFVQGVAPIFIDQGRGSRVWDVDGNEFIDYAMSLGPVILGHNYPRVTEAVKKVLEKGTTFTLPHALEFELAKLLCEIIPCAQMVRFGKNGSDATSGAVRLARAYTSRDKIACCGYHGWQDWYIATTTMNKGIPKEVKKLTLTFEYNKIETLEKIFHGNKGQVACVIMEPVGVEEPKGDFLRKVKDITHKNGAILIFDEVVTGFRISLGGAQEYFKINPDLACFGKAMANGFPISAIVGKRDLMKLFKEVFYSFTFGGEIVSISAAIATIKEIREKKVIPYIWEQGRKIKDGYNVLARGYGLEKYTQCIGLYPRTVVTFKNLKNEDDLPLKSLFQQECIKRGILFTGSHNISFSHSNKDVDYTLRVYNSVLKIIKDAVSGNKIQELLKGSPVKPVFRRA